MFQINRKEYANMIYALGELQNVLETERETQQFMSDDSEDSFKGAAGMAMRASLTVFLNQGAYEKAYQQSKKMKESMESLLPLVVKLLWEADTLAIHLEEEVLTNSFIPYYVLYPQSNNEIFMLDETYVNSVEQGCEDLVQRGQFLKNQMQAAINKCAGIIDCSAEQAALDEAEKSVLRITDFQEAFRSYVAGVRDLDESLRLDFALLTDEEDIECGKALQKVVHENSEEQKVIIRIREILAKPVEEWTEEDKIYIDKNFTVAVSEGIMINTKENLDLVTEQDLIEWGWNSNIVNEVMVSELNRVLIKYEINTSERIAHFMAQCLFESGTGIYVYEIGSENYFVDSSYGSKYRGVGYIQMTHEYGYQAFATFLTLNAFPELQEEGIKYKSPFHFGAEIIEQEYEKMVCTAEKLGIDISYYTEIVEQGYTYVCQEFAWECAGYFWDTKAINEKIDKGATPDEVSMMINRNDIDTFSTREKIYENIINLIN